MSSGQILLIIAVIAAIYLDWLLIKWMQKKRDVITELKTVSKQIWKLYTNSLLGVVKQKSEILMYWWKRIRPVFFDIEEENLQQQLPSYTSHSSLKATFVVLGSILAIVLISIAIVLMRKQELSPSLILLATALLFFFLVGPSIEKRSPFNEKPFILKPILIPGIALLTSFGLTVAVILNTANYVRTSELDHAATIKWILSIFSLIVGILWLAGWKPAHLQDILEWIKSNKIEFCLATAVILVGLIIRITALTEHPYPWSGDEASVGLDAVRILNGKITNLFDTSWSGNQTLLFLPTAFSMIFFGRTMFAIKMMSVLTGTLSVLALYLLAREWFGNKAALLASGFLVAFPFHLQFSRIGVDNIVDSLMAPLVLWLIFRATRLKSLPTYLLAGIMTGFTIYTYVGTRLVLAMAIGTILYIVVKRKFFLKNNLLQLGTYFAGLVVTAAPQATFFIRHPDLFMTRLGQEGILLNGWLASQVEQTGQSTGHILLDQFSKTILVFISQNAGTNFLNFDRPYLTVLGAVFFLIGLTATLRHLFEERNFILQMWFWSVLTLGGLLTVSPPAHTRLVMTTPATGLFVALGILQMSNLLLSIKFKRILIYASYSLLIFTLGYQNLAFYFGSYWEGRYFQDASGELGMESGLRLQKLGENYDFYLLGSPRVYAHFPTTDFLTPNNIKYDLRAESISELLLNPKQGAYFVAIPENRGILQQIIKKYPGGSVETVTRQMATEVLYYAYLLPPQLSNSP